MEKLTPNIYKFPPQKFFGETVGAYAVVQEKAIFCYDVPADTERNRSFLEEMQKPVRIIMSHGPTSSGVESIRDSLRGRGLDVEIWLHEEDKGNVWLTIDPDVLLPTKDAEKLSEDLTLIFTPGHSKGSVCLFADVADGIIFSGDTLQGTENGDVRPLETKTNDLGNDIFFKSLRKLLGYEFTIIYPFHDYPITNARRKLIEFINKHDSQKA
jgi:hypothetical protein